MSYWKNKEHLDYYLNDIRSALPLSETQLEIIVRIVAHFNPDIQTFLDLGCGDGLLGKLIYQQYPDAKGVFLDLSEEMIDKAKHNTHKNSEYIVYDFGKADWCQLLKSINRFDLVISGFAIHHIEDVQKRRLYNDIYGILNPKGVFLNLEHVASASSEIQKLWKDLLADNLLEHHRKKSISISKDEIIRKYSDPDHEAANLLLSVEQQCEWLREIGFQHVDCFLKIYELALFGGIRGTEHV